MDTTINVHTDTLRILHTAAISMKISLSEITMRLMKKVMNDMGNKIRTGTMVKYQERCIPIYWRTLHIYLQEEEYEYLLDLRKLLKMSVSLILAYAVRKYLQKKDRSINDKNLFTNYLIVKEMVSGIICWKLFWGHPRDKLHS